MEPPPPPPPQGKIKDLLLSDATKKKQPGGWKAMPFILGNETFERLATIGLFANFMVYLIREYHMDQVTAANFLNIWSGCTNFAPLLGAFISDAYAGRFRTIAVSSFFALSGMVTLTLTAWVPQLHPPPCPLQHPQCNHHTTTQLAILLLGLIFISVGSGGIRPCSIPFGVDQFDPATEEGAKGITSFYNWYYTTFTVVIILALTVVVYIQDSVSWALGFGIPTGLMALAIVMFFFGTRIYVYVNPEGSVFSGIAQVVVAAYKKRRIGLPAAEEDRSVYYDPPLKGTAVLYKLPLTEQFRFLNKAAIVGATKELNPDGSPANKWRLSSIQQVEEIKCLIRIIPIWASGILSLASIVQQGTFTVSQALKMDRHIGPNFQIPPGSVAIISMLTIGIWVPIYDRIIVPNLRKITKHEGGITLLQRIGTGIVFSVLAMVVAGVVERHRRAAAEPLSIIWLAPQLILMGFCEAFNIIGQIEFYNRQFPEHMKSIANALFSCSFGGASYVSSLLIVIVHACTGKQGRPDWLTSDINVGKLDYFYFLIGGLGVVNFVYFLYVSRRYRYKGRVEKEEEEEEFGDDLKLISFTI